MHSSVLFEIFMGLVIAQAHVTVERLPTVCAQMSLQSSFSREAFTTSNPAALEASLIRVGSDMTLQVGRFEETPVAVCAVDVFIRFASSSFRC